MSYVLKEVKRLDARRKELGRKCASGELSHAEYERIMDQIDKEEQQLFNANPITIEEFQRGMSKIRQDLSDMDQESAELDRRIKEVISKI
jgi:hypothetical protein